MPKREHLYSTAVAVLLLTAGCGGVAVAGRSPETDLAAPGAPLYEKAVKESVISLMSKQEQSALEAAGRPPSPGPDYYWCENCKTYHKRQAPALAPQPAVAQKPGAAPAATPQPDAATAARPPSPGADYYWCENCKTYHKRQTPAPAQQPAVAQSPGAGPVSPPQPDTGTAESPPSPGPDSFWCENCKTYHKRQTPGASPAAPHVHDTPAAAGEAAKAQSGEFYYCENCKTYHRRQSSILQPAAQTNRIFGGVSNSFILNSLTAP